MEGVLTHCVIHGLDIIEAVPLDRRVPDERIARVLGIVAGPGAPNFFNVDLSGVELRADDLDWSCGSGAVVTGSAQALAPWRVAACCRRAGWAGRRPRASPGAEGYGLGAAAVSRQVRQATYPPARSAAREKPSWRSDAAARLDAYPSEQTTTTCWS